MRNEKNLGPKTSNPMPKPDKPFRACPALALDCCCCFIELRRNHSLGPASKKLLPQSLLQATAPPPPPAAAPRGKREVFFLLNSACLHIAKKTQKKTPKLWSLEWPTHLIRQTWRQQIVCLVRCPKTYMSGRLTILNIS